MFCMLIGMKLHFFCPTRIAWGSTLIHYGSRKALTLLTEHKTLEMNHTRTIFSFINFKLKVWPTARHHQCLMTRVEETRKNCDCTALVRTACTQEPCTQRYCHGKPNNHHEGAQQRTLQIWNKTMMGSSVHSVTVGGRLQALYIASKLFHFISNLMMVSQLWSRII